MLKFTTPTFRPKEETSIIPIWISLPELPWHCYHRDILSPLLSPIGKVLYLDTTSIQKTRGSVARVKVQIDLTKERPPHVWMGLNEEDLNIGRWQTIEYEHIPDYCMYCKHQGDLLHVSTIKQREEEFKKRKELEADRKNKNKGEQGKQDSRNLQIQYTNREDGNTSSIYQPYQKQGNNKKLMKNGRLRRGKLTDQFNIAWTYQNLLRKHCSSSRLITRV
ncbi:hypothetical protein H5410_003275 [Solanum commersonii]|uniref:DUF4283 domain-containing protein n=1 Tax=Solanum commersonii TaxID=4109 RepID=A0A9J6B480_SOLCO|nr:hypothetical protein H5410_003275 [Solanum commersonii]